MVTPYLNFQEKIILIHFKQNTRGHRIFNNYKTIILTRLNIIKLEKTVTISVFDPVCRIAEYLLCSNSSLGRLESLGYMTFPSVPYIS